MAEAEAAQGAEGAEPKKKRGKGMILLLGVVALAALGAAGFLWQQNKARQQADAQAAWDADPVLETVVYPLQALTVNLAEGDRYIRCQVAIGFELDPLDAHHFRLTMAKIDPDVPPEPEPPPADAKLPPREGPSEAVLALIRLLLSADVQTRMQDSLLLEVSSREFAELQSAEGKEGLKTVLLERFAAIVDDAAGGTSPVPMTDIYLREFVMQ